MQRSNVIPFTFASRRKVRDYYQNDTARSADVIEFKGTSDPHVVRWMSDQQRAAIIDEMLARNPFEG